MGEGFKDLPEPAHLGCSPPRGSRRPAIEWFSLRTCKASGGVRPGGGRALRPGAEAFPLFSRVVVRAVLARNVYIAPRGSGGIHLLAVFCNRPCISARRRLVSLHRVSHLLCWRKPSQGIASAVLAGT